MYILWPEWFRPLSPYQNLFCIRDKSKFDASLNELHNDFVCVHTDKSNNNVTIVCNN